LFFWGREKRRITAENAEVPQRALRRGKREGRREKRFGGVGS
jgi:hypothetical protein